MPDRVLDDVELWRSRAEQTRVLAAGMEDLMSRLIMLGIARDYDQLADRAAERQAARRKSEE